MSRDAIPSEVARILATLPRYYTYRDLLEAFSGDQARLLDAYALGWLDAKACAVLESDPTKLACWLLGRLTRLALEAQAQAPRSPA